MTNKIIAWSVLITTILATIGWLSMTQEENWLFVLVYMIGVAYVCIRYVESLK